MQSPLSLKRTFRTISSMLTLAALAYPLGAQYNASPQRDNPTNLPEQQSAYSRSVVESAAFADQKEDPTASTYALEFLPAHPDIATDLTVQPAAPTGASTR